MYRTHKALVTEIELLKFVLYLVSTTESEMK
jgi:hypothetical protein